VFFVGLPLLFAGCGDDDGPPADGGAETDGGGGGGDGGGDGGGGSDGGTMVTPVALTFRGQVGDEAFSCGGTYDGVGSTMSTFTALDFRFYVSNVRLVRGDGTEAPLTLEQDGMWQHMGVALLDFEDGTGGCAAGNAQLNATVVGTVEGAGPFTGVRFDLGIPFELNHANSAVAPPPLNLTAMFWNWQGGYKFLRVDGTSTVQPSWVVHLGSTGCDGSIMGDVTMCTNENIVTVELAGFDPETQVIVADLALLLDGVDIDANQLSSPPGCMATPSDPDCAGVFENLGLPFGSAAGGAQSFFRVE
jgi:uncharacterized repeat protein (TIGR04052 family)